MIFLSNFNIDYLEVEQTRVCNTGIHRTTWGKFHYRGLLVIPVDQIIVSSVFNNVGAAEVEVEFGR